MSLLIWTFTFGLIAGVVSLKIIYNIKKQRYRKIADTILNKTESDIQEMQKKNDLAIKQKEIEHKQELEKIKERSLKKIQEAEERLKKREDNLENRLHSLEKKSNNYENQKKQLENQLQELELEKEKTKQKHESFISKLEEISKINKDTAREILLKQVEDQVINDSANITRRMQSQAKENAEKEAKKIIVNAINRLATKCTADATTTSVILPNKEIKGRLIGREGRNIRFLEQKTGVNFVIDDNSGSVTISGFDPIRNHIAKKTINELVLDGRIHPSRIEEVIEKITAEVQNQIDEAGKNAIIQIQANDINPELIKLIGKLQFRYSYGQNILNHSIEVANIMGIMAAELGLNVNLAKRIGLLHDIGKAVSHETEGSHAIVGYNIAKKYDESQEVINGIGAHHNEMKPETLEAVLCSSADAISASRPGARIEAIEQYIKRLEKLESIASTIPGVETAYALQAGKEVRVMVSPEEISEEETINLARTLAKKIQKELTYPGQIKITVLREKRVVEYAK